MKEKIYMAILTITIKSPQGYKPRMMSSRCGFIIENKKISILDKIKSDELKRINKIVMEKIPNVKTTIAASFEIIKLDTISAQYINLLNNN